MRLGVVGCVTVAIVFGAVYLVRAVDRLSSDASRNASLNFDDREFGGGNSLVVDKRALYEMSALVPERGSYRIVPGPNVKDATDLTEQYIDQYARYFLMPRRPSSEAPWILCYGCDPTALGEQAQVVWDNGGGILILRPRP